MKLDHYQIEGANFLVTAKKCILADSMGLGKTAQALHALNNINAQKILIVCPKTVRHGWINEVVKWFGPNVKTKILTTKNAIPVLDGTLNIINYDIVANKKVYPLLAKGGPYDVIICDEAHKLKNTNSKRSVALLGKHAGLAVNCNYLWLLTGTPVLNRPEELYPLLSAVNNKALGQYSNFFPFAKRFCNARQTDWGWDFSGASNLQELSALVKPIMLRRHAADVGIDITKPKQQLVILEKTETITDEEIKTEINAYRDPKNQMLGEIAELRRKLALEKVGQVTEFIKDLLDCREKIVVFAHHIAVINTLASSLAKYNPVIVNGKTIDKQKAIDTFITNKNCRIYLGNYEASAEGIDGLQTVCDTMVTAELIWTPKIIEQAIGRLARRGQKNLVNVYHCIIKDSADQEYLDALLRKEKISNEILTENENQFKLLTSNENKLDKTFKKGVTMFNVSVNEVEFKAFIKAAVAEALSETAPNTKKAKKVEEVKPAEVVEQPAEKVQNHVEQPAEEVQTPPVQNAIPADFNYVNFRTQINNALANVRLTNAALSSETARKCREMVLAETGCKAFGDVTDPDKQYTVAKKIIAIYNADCGPSFGELSIS